MLKNGYSIKRRSIMWLVKKNLEFSVILLYDCPTIRKQKSLAIAPTKKTLIEFCCQKVHVFPPCFLSFVLSMKKKIRLKLQSVIEAQNQNVFVISSCVPLWVLTKGLNHKRLEYNSFSRKFIVNVKKSNNSPTKSLQTHPCLFYPILSQFWSG